MRRALFLPLLLVLALVSATASPAATTSPAARAAGCPAEQLSRPFLPWLDPFTYALAAGGTFEAANSWSGGSIVSGNEPWRVHGSADARALSLSAGQSTTTPFMCTGLTKPTLRFFAKGSLLGVLKVDVIYRTLLGLNVTQPAGVVAGTGLWAPTLPIIYLGNNLASLNIDGSSPSIAFRFTATIGSWRIDDVYVDPLASRCC